VAPGDGQIRDVLRIDCLAYFGIRGVHSLYAIASFYLRPDAFDTESGGERSDLPNGEG
jgi:hypothetical protein